MGLTRQCFLRTGFLGLAASRNAGMKTGAGAEAEGPDRPGEVWDVPAGLRIPEYPAWLRETAERAKKDVHQVSAFGIIRPVGPGHHPLEPTRCPEACKIILHVTRNNTGRYRVSTGNRSRYALLHDPTWAAGDTMLYQLVKDEYLLEQNFAGPMGPYLDGLATQLLELGYSHCQSRKIVRTASLPGIWLAERGLTPADAGKAEIQEYMASHRRTPKGRLRDEAARFGKADTGEGYRQPVQGG